MRTRYLLDTNVLVHLVNKRDGHERIGAKLREIPKANLLVSAITVWEVSRMAERARAPTRAVRALENLLAEFASIPLTANEAALSGSLAGHLELQGIRISDRDTMIAGTAIYHYLIMVTDNVGEFARVPGILIENWRAA